MKILIADGLDREAQDALSELGHDCVCSSVSVVAPGEFDAIIVRSATKLTAPVIETGGLGRLKLIIRAGVGLDNIDLSAAKAAGISVRNTPNAPTNAVAELAVAHMLSCARSVSRNGCAMRQGLWEKQNGTELAGKILGILGYGRIGKRIAELAQGFGMEILAYDPEQELQTFDEVLSQADILVVAAPALPSPLIGRAAVEKMKDGVILINISRGCNVDEEALLDGLNSGKIKAAGLDVWHNEPKVNQALRDHPAVSCTPHIGASTREAQRRIGQEVVEIIRSFHP